TGYGGKSSIQSKLTPVAPSVKQGSTGQLQLVSKASVQRVIGPSGTSMRAVSPATSIEGSASIPSTFSAKGITAIAEKEVVSDSEAPFSASPHTFRDYLNPVNYDSNGHYTGDYRSPAMQTAQAVVDYNNWINNGGIGLPSVDFRKKGGDIQATIPAQNIFDVYDANNPDFWSYKSRSQSDYITMATYIPLVRKHLESGKMISDVEKMGGVIGACATNYFRNPVTVMKAGEAYIHCNDGRHRTVAAQIAKVEMPVCIVQEFSISKFVSSSADMTHIPMETLPKNQILSGKISVFSKHTTKLGADFVDDMHNIMKSSFHSDIATVYKKYADHLTIYEAQDINGRALYKHGKGVILNTNIVKNGSRIHKPYQVAFHEFGHNLDYLLGGGTPISEKWENGALYKAIEKDFKALKGSKSNEELIDSLRRQKKEYKWTNMAIASVSDILECMTGIDYPLGSGHGRVVVTITNPDGSTTDVVQSYWKDRLPCKEFFAEVLDGAMANEESYNMLKNMFPNAVSIVHKIVGGAIE
ncbi:MAG: hypothetical protein K2H01_07525, partial [Ruminococcus sp.]|nr:hypothetical protein [Ruminococcus sp.]